MPAVRSNHTAPSVNSVFTDTQIKPRNRAACVTVAADTVAAGAFELRRGPQGPGLVASGKACPHASCSGVSPDILPSMTGHKTMCGVGAGT